MNSDSENEEENKKASKWDWDHLDNYNLYYKEKTNSQKITNDSFNDDRKVKICASYDEFTEKEVTENVDNRPNFQQLIGHSNCVNRIYWSNKFENKNLLLSSSMDR